MTCQRSHICWCASCCFASSVCFGSFCLASSETGVAFLQEEYCTHQFAWVFFFFRSMFAFILLFVDFVRYLTFWHDMIQIYRCSRKKSVDYFVCSICRYGIDQALFHQLKVRCNANAIAFHIAQLLCYCEKDNLCSLLDSGRKIFHWSKLTMLSPWVQPWVRGRSAGSFPEQRLVIEPRGTCVSHYCL